MEQLNLAFEELLMFKYLKHDLYLIYDWSLPGENFDDICNLDCEYVLTT